MSETIAIFVPGIMGHNQKLDFRNHYIQALGYAPKLEAKCDFLAANAGHEFSVLADSVTTVSSPQHPR